MATVAVVSLSKTETYTLNGHMVTVGDAVQKFLGKTEGVSVRLNARPEADFDKALRDADSIFIIENPNLASAGIKGN